MVAIFTGWNTGLADSSASVLGARGQIGQAAMGRAGENIYLNAARGDLVVTAQDEMLFGTGPDGGVGRFGSPNWWSPDRFRVADLSGALNTEGSSIWRYGADSAQFQYHWSVPHNAYVATAGGGAYDTLTFSGSTWTWTDGDTGVVETYDSTNQGRITSRSDTDGNVVTYSYNAAGKLSRVTTASGEYTDLIYTGALLTQLTTTMANGQTSTSVRYGYNATNRLTTVTVDLSPND